MALLLILLLLNVQIQPSMAKNSLVGNINKRKALGTSRPKSKSTVSAKSYAAMKSGWKNSK
jgi:hypothetical protein